jgi:hypothetical protein
MMFVRYSPRTSRLSKADSKPEFQLFAIAIRVDAGASSDSGSEGDIVSSGNVDVVKGKSGPAFRTTKGTCSMFLCTLPDPG